MAKHSSASNSPARDVIPVSAAEIDLPDGACRGLLVGVGGTATLKTTAGQTRADVPLVTGWNPIGCLQVISLGTAENVWAVY